jgi:predicted membrane chloride channel (bestrophin family)
MYAPRRLQLLIVGFAAALYNALNLLVDALTGLERVLTTPIPFS